MLLLSTSVYSDLFLAALQLTFVCFPQVLQQWCQRAEDIFNSEYTIYTTWTLISTYIEQMSTCVIQSAFHLL